MQTMPAFVHGFSEMTSTASSAALRCSSRKVAFDFEEYLISSSPPSFSYSLAEKSVGQESLTDFSYQDSDFQFPLATKQSTISNESHDNPVRSSIQEKQRSLFNNSPLLSDTMVNSYGQDFMGKDAVMSYPSKRTSRGGRAKKVSFADDFGLRLTDIKYFFETPDMPPIIKTKAMLRSTRLLPLCQDFVPSITNVASVNPLLVPDFPMPISNHESFSSKLEKDFVSLESLYVATNQTLVGTVKVKNIDFIKTVFVRCTFDGWKSSVDMPCKYRPSSYLEANNHSFDWFTFTIDVPSYINGRGSAEFAVCFQCNGNQYWDNNMGSNYKLVSPDWFKKDNDQHVHGNTDLRWTTYVEWNDRSWSWPYW